MQKAPAARRVVNNLSFEPSWAFFSLPRAMVSYGKFMQHLRRSMAVKTDKSIASLFKSSSIIQLLTFCLLLSVALSRFITYVAPFSPRTLRLIRFRFPQVLMIIDGAVAFVTRRLLLVLTNGFVISHSIETKLHSSAEDDSAGVIDSTSCRERKSCGTHHHSALL